MRFFTLIIVVISLVNCASNEYYDYKKHPEFGQPFTIKKLTESKYEIEFRGTPLTSIEEAIEEWDYRATGICQGKYKSIAVENPKLADTKLVKSNPRDPGVILECSDLQIPDPLRIQKEVSEKEKLGCIIYMALSDKGPETEKGTYPIVKGEIECLK